MKACIEVEIDLLELGFAEGDVVALGGPGDLMDIVALVEAVDQHIHGSILWEWTPANGVVVGKQTPRCATRNSTRLSLVIQRGTKHRVGGGTEPLTPGTRWNTDAGWAFRKVEWPDSIVPALEGVPALGADPQERGSHWFVSPEAG